MKRRVDRGLLVASVVIAVGLILIGFAAWRGVTGDERTNLPDAIERIAPVPDAINVPQQSSVTVDLADGYTGRLEIDGQRLETDALGSASAVPPEPGTQVVRPPGVFFDQGVNTLTLTLGEEIGLPRWDVGPHTVTVVYWPIEETEDSSGASYHWTFTIV